MGSLPAAPDSKPVGSYPDSGIDVLIVGTGLAGLTAAIECTRKGHQVRVLERNANINTAGELISLVADRTVVVFLILHPARRHVFHGIERHQVHEALASPGRRVP
jgi:2-polyprenyl-6-methoxyphenol hydroxylase-like FAD-dependent oxidoreductase